MNRNLFWRFFFVVLIVAWAAWYTYPPQARNLIDVFEEKAVTRGETNALTTLRAIVAEARKLDRENPTRTFANLRQAIGTNEITHFFPAIKVPGEKDPARAVLQKLQQKSAGQIKLGLDLQGGTSFLVRVKPRNETTTNDVAALRGEKERVLEQAVEVLRRRVDKFGVAEPEIRLEGENQIRVQLPGLSEADKEAAKSQIQKAAFLEFRIVHPESSKLLAQGLSAPGYEALQEVTKREEKKGREPVYLVKKRPERGLTGNYVQRAMVTTDPMSGRPEISLTFKTKGAEIFAEVTKEHVGHQLAIVLDGEL